MNERNIVEFLVSLRLFDDINPDLTLVGVTVFYLNGTLINANKIKLSNTAERAVYFTR